jgi:hypothetical protein
VIEILKLIARRPKARAQLNPETRAMLGANVIHVGGGVYTLSLKGMNAIRQSLGLALLRVRRRRFAPEPFSPPNPLDALLVQDSRT